jgi:hypothetical protein
MRGAERPGLVVVRIDGGNEPPEFTHRFAKWDKARAKVRNAHVRVCM